jgi:hypothetical protein
VKLSVTICIDGRCNDPKVTPFHLGANPGQFGTGVKAPEKALEEAAVSPSLAASSLSLPGDSFNSVPSADTEDVPDFATKGLRIIAVVGYRRKWKCSEAALARAARVHRSDLSKWKKLRLPAGSDKSARIEKALTQNAKPVRPTPPIEF